MVTSNQVVKPNPTREFMAAAALALPVGLERRLRMMEAADRRQRESTRQSEDRLHGMAVHRSAKSGPPVQQPGRGVVHGRLPQHADARRRFHASLGHDGSDRIRRRVAEDRAITYGVPAYWAFRMYSTADATRLVDSTVKVETYDVEEGVRRIPSIPGVPYLDVAAALNADGRRLTLFCVNRDPAREIRANVTLNGFEAHAAKGQQLTAPDLYTVNDDATPEAVIPSAVSVEASGGRLRHTFPPRSVTVIELEK